MENVCNNVLTFSCYKNNLLSLARQSSKSEHPLSASCGNQLTSVLPSLGGKKKFLDSSTLATCPSSPLVSSTIPPGGLATRARTASDALPIWHPTTLPRKCSPFPTRAAPGGNQWSRILQSTLQTVWSTLVCPLLFPIFPCALSLSPLRIPVVNPQASPGLFFSVRFALLQPVYLLKTPENDNL